MRVTREKAEENRAKVVETASRLFRERGFGGIGVADIMKCAGLTHGGFYGQFGSKEELEDEACAHAFAKSIAKWQRRSAGLAPEDGFAAIVRAYLSRRHRDGPGSGCALSTLGIDVGRQQGPVRRTFVAGFSSLAGILESLLPGRSKAARRENALAALSTLVGAIVLSRAVEDDALADEILKSSAGALGVDLQAAALAQE